jgi:hypothetical protein
MKSLQKLIDIEKYLLKLERNKKNSFGADSESSSLRKSVRNTNTSTSNSKTFNCNINDPNIIDEFKNALYEYIPKKDRFGYIEATDLDETVINLKVLYINLLDNIDNPDERDVINKNITTIYNKIKAPKLWYYGYFTSLTNCIQDYIINKLNETPPIEPKIKKAKSEKIVKPTDLPLDSIDTDNWNNVAVPLIQSIQKFDKKILKGYHDKLIRLKKVIDDQINNLSDGDKISQLIDTYFIDTQRREWNGIHVKIQKLYVKSLYDPIINKYKTLNPDNNNILLSSNNEIIVNDENPETVKIDLYDIYKENYYGTGFDELPSPDFDLRKQLKWLICFCILFYIDSLHDFYSEVDNGENFKTHIKDRFDAFIIYLVNNFKIKLEGEETDFIITIEEALIYGLNINVDNNILFSKSDTRWYREYDNGDFTDIYAEVEVYLYYTEYLGNVRNTNNINSRLKRTRTNNNSSSNNTKYPKYILRSQDSLVVCSEYLIAIMGVQKINLKAFQKTVTGSNNSKHHNIIIKLISHINSLGNNSELDILKENNESNNEMKDCNFINSLVNDNINDNNFPYTIGVDALSKVEKRSPVTSIISDSIELGNQNTYIDSFISTLDGASTDNSIKTKLKSLNQRIIYHDFSKLTFDIHFTDISIMKFIYIKESGEPKMIITNYFGFEIPERGLIGNKDEYYPNTRTVKVRGIIKKNNTISIQSIIDKINIYNNPTKYNYTIFKTLLDFSKILHFWSYNNYRVVPAVINNMDINRTDHHLFLLNDVLAANMSALFIKNTCVEETAEIAEVGLDERHYWLFLRSYMLNKIWENSEFKNDNIVRMTGIKPVNIGAFGKSKNFIKIANEKSVKNGTIGTFGKWCRSNGLASVDGKVTKRCIKSAKKSGNTTLIRRAVFAQNIGGYKGANKNNKK